MTTKKLKAHSTHLNLENTQHMEFQNVKIKDMNFVI